MGGFKMSFFSVCMLCDRSNFECVCFNKYEKEVFVYAKKINKWVKVRK